tara:strand:+ start:716 stop:820 length:105 start_codon:yes stop_codon:yes gene_type:complete
MSDILITLAVFVGGVLIVSTVIWILIGWINKWQR